jgi:hypothetical protein
MVSLCTENRLRFTARLGIKERGETYHFRSHLGDGGLVRFACPRRQPGGLRLARHVGGMVYLFTASTFTVVTAGAWHTLAFVVRPFG